jgi:hypothetical protein
VDPDPDPHQNVMPFRKKKKFPFPLTPANLLGSGQTISNGAANTFFLLITLGYTVCC